jgi:hypothetical protein
MIELAWNGGFEFRNSAGGKPWSLVDAWRPLRRRFRLVARRARHAVCHAINAGLDAARIARARVKERWCAWRDERRALAEPSRLDDRCLRHVGLRRVRTSSGDQLIVPIPEHGWTVTSALANNNAPPPRGGEVDRLRYAA